MFTSSEHNPIILFNTKLSFKKTIKTISDYNVHHNAPNCTFSSKFSRREASVFTNNLSMCATIILLFLHVNKNRYSSCQILKIHRKSSIVACFHGFSGISV